MPGATSQSFTPTASGSYAASIDKAGCVDTTTCFVVTGVGVDENTQVPFRVFPNPATTELTITWPMAQKATLKLFDYAGKLVHAESTENAASIILALPAARGLYIVEVELNGHTYRQRISVL